MSARESERRPRPPRWSYGWWLDAIVLLLAAEVVAVVVLVLLVVMSR